MLVYSSDLCDSLCCINHPLDAALWITTTKLNTQCTVIPPYLPCYCTQPTAVFASMTWFHSFTQGMGGGVAQPRLVEAEEDERVEAGKEKAVMEKERLGMEGREGLMWGSRLEKNKNNTVVLLLKSFCFTVQWFLLCFVSPVYADWQNGQHFYFNAIITIIWRTKTTKLLTAFQQLQRHKSKTLMKH